MNEIIQLRTQNSKTYDLGNNQRQLVSSIGSVHYWDESWKDIDLNIVPCNLFEFEYYCYKNNFIAYFNDSTDVVNCNLASFEIKNSQGTSRWINYKLVGATPSRVEVNENRIKYFDCYPGIDVEYFITDSKLKELITVKDRASYRDVEFSIKLDGCHYLKDESGNIVFYDDVTNEELYRIVAPFAYDASFEDGLDYVYGQVEYEFSSVEIDGIQYESIKVVVDDIWLNDADYPVVIDPTTTLQTVAGANDGNIEYTGIQTAQTSILFGRGSSAIYGIFCRFTNVTISQGATINSALIQYRSKTSESSSGVITRLYLNAEDNAIAPTTYTEYNAKAVTSAYADWLVPSFITNTWYTSPEIKNAVQEVVNRAGWVSGNALLLLHKDNGSSASSYRNVYAYEYSGNISGPKLSIEYTEGVPSSIKTIMGLARASIKTINGIPIASVKNINGLA